ncbi:hypothetical protein KC345_g189 [Hortaea werneckii]|nr:hypothetical protein KC345_g189 [Hortaea werneckii]
MVSTILIRTLRKDIKRYNRLDQLGLDDLGGGDSVEDGVVEDSGWKLVHGDVFRAPKHSLALSVLVGNGAQLFMMTGFTIAFAVVGFLSPSNRGSLATVMILLYTFFGFIGGYVSFSSSRPPPSQPSSSPFSSSSTSSSGRARAAVRSPSPPCSSSSASGSSSPSRSASQDHGSASNNHKKKHPSARTRSRARSPRHPATSAPSLASSLSASYPSAPSSSSSTSS